jgi:hypothetical protein
MSELAPGLCVSDFVKPGTALEMKTGSLIPGASPLTVALHPDDWARIPGPERERILDRMVRSDVARGLELIHEFLGAKEGLSA